MEELWRWPRPRPAPRGRVPLQRSSDSPSASRRFDLNSVPQLRHATSSRRAEEEALSLRCSFFLWQNFSSSRPSGGGSELSPEHSRGRPAFPAAEKVPHSQFSSSHAVPGCYVCNFFFVRNSIAQLRHAAEEALSLSLSLFLSHYVTLCCFFFVSLGYTFDVSYVAQCNLHSKCNKCYKCYTASVTSVTLQVYLLLQV